MANLPLALIGGVIMVFLADHIDLDVGRSRVSPERVVENHRSTAS